MYISSYLTYILICGNLIKCYAPMAQAVERHLGKVEATGSSPVGSCIKKTVVNLTTVFFYKLNLAM